VRIVAATNEHLPRLVEQGRFRADLLDRLSFEVVTLPPLRARKGDIPLLAEHFGRRMAVELDWPNWPGFSARAQSELEAYRWPGNVRELRNLVERLHLLNRNGFIDIGDLPADITELPADSPALLEAPTAKAGMDTPVFSFEEAERQAIRNALAAEGGNLSKVAQRLGISRPTLYRKLEQFGIRRGFV